jgi:hypothetical protein
MLLKQVESVLTLKEMLLLKILEKILCYNTRLGCLRPGRQAAASC